MEIYGMFLTGTLTPEKLCDLLNQTEPTAYVTPSSKHLQYSSI